MKKESLKNPAGSPKFINPNLWKRRGNNPRLISRHFMNIHRTSMK